MLSYFHGFSVFAWRGKNHRNTLRADAYCFEIQAHIRLQKYPDTCVRGFNKCSAPEIAPSVHCKWLDTPIFVWPWKMVSVSVRYLLYQPMDEKINTWPLRFPAKENMEKALFDWPIKSLYNHSIVVSFLFARFDFKVTRKSLYDEVTTWRPLKLDRLAKDSSHCFLACALTLA